MVSIKQQAMADLESEEIKNLHIEFEWLMQNEVQVILRKLHELLMECAYRFPIPLYDNDIKRTEKFHLIGTQDQLKCYVTLTGDSITQADISYKMKRTSNQIQHTSITSDTPWKLQQIQDAANHLQHAINHIINIQRDNYKFRSADEILHIITELIGALQRGRLSLIVPKKKSIEDIMQKKNVKSLTPNLPDDQTISFFLQCHKLVIAAYQIVNVQGTLKMEVVQADCTIDWLNDVLALLTVSLTLCQQLKDKIYVFKMDILR